MAAVRARASTRERILGVALALANEHGFDRVTTAGIAAAAGINEGNLYYYFRRKEQIAAALFATFEGEMMRIAEPAFGAPDDPESYLAYQQGWFRLMWDFRAFYRDGAVLRAMAPDLRAPMLAMNARGQAAVRRVFGLMRAHGLMRASDAEIELLIANIWIVSSYWMDFRGLEAGGATRPEDLAWGYRQVVALYAPYLTERGRPAADAAAAFRCP